MTRTPLSNVGHLHAHTEIYAALGFAISNFANIEFGMLITFHAVAATDWEKSIAVFYSLGSTRNQLKCLNELVRSAALDESESAGWRELKTSIESSIQNRDSLAHGEVVHLMRSADEAEVFFGPRFLKNFHKAEQVSPDWKPAEKFSRDQLVEIGEQFWVTGEQVCAFANRVRQQEAP